jgi:hypothetical protein
MVGETNENNLDREGLEKPIEPNQDLRVAENKSREGVFKPDVLNEEEKSRWEEADEYVRRHPEVDGYKIEGNQEPARGHEDEPTKEWEEMSLEEQNDYIRRHPEASWRKEEQEDAARKEQEKQFQEYLDDSNVASDIEAILTFDYIKPFDHDLTTASDINADRLDQLSVWKNANDFITQEVPEEFREQTIRLFNLDGDEFRHTNLEMAIRSTIHFKDESDETNHNMDALNDIEDNMRALFHSIDKANHRRGWM